MYPSTNMKSNNHQQDVYLDHHQNASSYNWDQSLRVPSFNPMPVSGYSIDYTDPVFCHPLSEQSLKNNNMAGNNNIKLNSQPHLSFTTTGAGARQRTVIASKRAAQNRAAQRAFRQRKERYIKDLERKAKLMDEWKLEMEQLRQQNKDLLQSNIKFEKQIHQQQQKIRQLEHNKASPVMSSAESSNVEIIPAPVVTFMDDKRKDEMFLPINLKAPSNANFVSSPTSSYSSSASSLNGYEELQQQHQQQYYQQNNLYLDSYESDFDLLPTTKHNNSLIYNDLYPNQRSDLDIIESPQQQYDLSRSQF